MVYNISDEFIKSACKAQKYILLGKLMKRYEVLADKKDLSDSQRKDLLRSLIKELVHESFRDLEKQFTCYSKGLQYYKINLDPIDSEKN